MVQTQNFNLCVNILTMYVLLLLDALELVHVQMDYPILNNVVLVLYRLVHLVLIYLLHLRIMHLVYPVIMNGHLQVLQPNIQQIYRIIQSMILIILDLILDFLILQMDNSLELLLLRVLHNSHNKDRILDYVKDTILKEYYNNL